LFKKILVPLDGSEYSMRALTIAGHIAKKFKARVTLIHIYSVVPIVQLPIMHEPTTQAASIIGPVVSPATLTEMAEAPKKIGERILLEATEELKSRKIVVETFLIEGNVVQEITRVAKEGNFDLVVMGIRGLSKIQELIMGSVSDGVIKQVQCPVLIVK